MTRRAHAPIALAAVLALLTFGLSIRGVVLCVATDHSALELFGNTCCDATARGQGLSQHQLASACCTDTALSIGDRNVDSHRRAAPEPTTATNSSVAIVLLNPTSQHRVAVLAPLHVPLGHHLRTVILRV